MRVLFMALVTSMASVGLANAGPDRTSQWLMDDPVSMMDFGILRMSLLLQAKNLGFPFFDWDGNKIVIRELKYFTETGIPSPFPDGEAWCANWVAEVRLNAGIDKSTGKPMFGQSSFSHFFEHAGFERTAAPDSLSMEIDKMIHLECIVVFSGTQTTVKAPLLGNEYFLER